MLALLTFGRDPGTGDFIDPWNVGAHGHFAADDLTASNLLRAVAYARSRADRGQAETGLFPVSNSEAPSKAAWSAPQASRGLVLDAVKFQASLLAAAGHAMCCDVLAELNESGAIRRLDRHHHVRTVTCDQLCNGARRRVNDARRHRYRCSALEPALQRDC